MDRSAYPPGKVRIRKVSTHALEDMYYYGIYRGLEILVDGEIGDEHIDVLFVNSKNKVIINLYLERVYTNTKDGRCIYTVELVEIDRKYQGFGVGPLVYREVMRRLDIILMGGWCQSGGARYLWAKLNTLSDVVVVAGKQSIPLHEVESDLDIRELTSPKFEIYNNKAKIYAFVI